MLLFLDPPEPIQPASISESVPFSYLALQIYNFVKSNVQLAPSMFFGLNFCVTLRVRNVIDYVVPSIVVQIYEFIMQHIIRSLILFIRFSCISFMVCHIFLSMKCGKSCFITF